MQVQIKFTASGSSQQTGNFAPGDILRCSKAEADHFVNEAGCAEYVKAGVNLPAKKDDLVKMTKHATKGDAK